MLVALTGLVATGGILALARRQIVIALVFATSTIPVLLNLIFLPKYSPEIALLFAAGSAALIFGGTLLTRRLAAPNRLGSDENLSWGHSATALALFALAGTAVHFGLGGIPILSSNVEIARFDVTSSGLLGIPGRIYLFGIPLALAVCLRAEAMAGRGAFSSWQSRLVIIIFAISRILSGFKGGLVELVLSAVLVYAASGHSLTRRLLLQSIAALILAVAFGTLVAVTYTTYQQRGVVAALIDRVTFQTSDPAAIVLADSNFHGLAISSIATDAGYFTSRYFGFGDPPEYSFSQLVSSRVTGTPLSPDNYLVPVTTTAIAEQIYDFGLPLACLSLALTGFTMQAALARGRRSARPASYLVSVAVVLGSFEYVTKGGLIYALYNWTAVCLLLLAVAAAYRIIVTRQRFRLVAPHRLHIGEAL